MSKSVGVIHGKFGRVVLYEMDRTISTHAHPDGHILLPLGGATPMVRTPQSIRALNSGAACIIGPWVPHQFEVRCPGDQVLCMALYIDPKWFACQSGGPAPIFSKSDQHIAALSGATLKMVDRLTGEMLTDFPSAAFDHTVLEIARACYEQLNSHAVECIHTPRRIDRRIAKVCGVFRERIGNREQLELSQIAAQEGLSRATLFKLFRQELGLTPKRYVDTLRLEFAYKRLAETQDAITTIGQDLGFSSQSNFSRFFVENVGVPPLEYRKRALTLADCG